MKALKEKGKKKPFGYTVGGLVFCIPNGINPKKPIIKITIGETQARVPISRFFLTLEECLGLIKQIYESMIKEGWPEPFVKQFLPKVS